MSESISDEAVYEAILKIEDLTFDLSSGAVSRRGAVLILPRTSREILKVLVVMSPAAVSRRQLEQVLWAGERRCREALRSCIYDLRRVVDDPYPTKLIRTVPRVGFKISSMQSTIQDSAKKPLSEMVQCAYRNEIDGV